MNNNRQENIDDSEEDLKQEEGICKTTDWTPWAECSVSCGIGFTMRARRFLDRLGRKKCPHVIIGIIFKLPHIYTISLLRKYIFLQLRKINVWARLVNLD